MNESGTADGGGDRREVEGPGARPGLSGRSAGSWRLMDHAECAALSGLAAFVVEAQAAPRRVRRLAPGEILFHAGEPSDHLYVVRAGEVESRLTSASGREIQVARARSGDAVGEICLCAARLRPASAVATTAVEAVSVSAQDVVDYVLAGPDQAFGVLEHLFHRVADLTQRLETLAFAGTRARLVDRLLALAAATASEAGGAVRLPPRSHEDWAREVFTTREQVTSILADLRRAGAIRYEGHPSTIVVDPERLRALGAAHAHGSVQDRTDGGPAGL